MPASGSLQLNCRSVRGFTRADVRRKSAPEGMTVTGTGRLAARLPFTPQSIRTEGLTVTGTGSVR